MGSKNLKAIAVRGTGVVNVAKPKDLIDLWYYYRRLLNRTPAEVKAGDGWPNQTKSVAYTVYHGTQEGRPAKPKNPAVYFKNNGLDDPICLMREAVDKGTVKLKYGGCYACPVCCAMAYQSTDLNIPSGSGQCNDTSSWVHYEWAGFKKTAGIPSIWFSRWTDDLGLGITEALGYHYFWFHDLVTLGILTKENTGVPIDQFWSLEFIRGTLENLAYRKGDLYNQMAEGQERFLKSLAEKNPKVKPICDGIFHQAGGYFIHWHTEPPSPGSEAIMRATGVRREINKVTGGFGKSLMSDATGLTAAQLIEVQKKGNKKYFGAEDAVEISGVPLTWNNKVTGAIMCQNLSALMDCVTYCGWAGAYSLYSTYTPPDYLGDWAIGAKVFSAVTGKETTHEQMVDAMNPVFNIERCNQVREGRRREHDTFNDATFKLDSWKGTSREEFNKVLDEYYTRRGWDLKTGIPKRSTLEKQGLKKIADELETKYKISVPA